MCLGCSDHTLATFRSFGTVACWTNELKMCQTRFESANAKPRRNRSRILSGPADFRLLVLLGSWWRSSYGCIMSISLILLVTARRGVISRATCSSESFIFVVSKSGATICSRFIRAVFEFVLRRTFGADASTHGWPWPCCAVVLITCPCIKSLTIESAKIRQRSMTYR